MGTDLSVVQGRLSRKDHISVNKCVNIRLEKIKDRRDVENLGFGGKHKSFRLAGSRVCSRRKW